MTAPSLAVLGIDPGVRGGLAVLSATGEVAMVRGFTPAMTEAQFADIVNTALNKASVVYVEKVGYIAGDGGQGAFTFGRVAGLIAGVVLARGVTPHYVTPQLWQSRLGCLTGGNKNVTKHEAIRLFPSVAKQITHAVADALLIARYGQIAQAASLESILG